MIYMYYSNSHSQNQCETVTNEIILELKKKIEKEFTESDWAMIHHRALIYLKNGEGLKALENDLYQKLTNLVKT